MVKRYFFCEPVTATGISPWHIRLEGKKGHRPTGGADTPALCGRKVSCDLYVPVGLGQISMGGICKTCVHRFVDTHQFVDAADESL